MGHGRRIRNGARQWLWRALQDHPARASIKPLFGLRLKRIRRLRLDGGLPEQLDEQIDGLRLSTVGRGRGGQARASRQEPAYGAGRRPNVGTRSGALYGAQMGARGAEIPSRREVIS